RVPEVAVGPRPGAARPWCTHVLFNETRPFGDPRNVAQLANRSLQLAGFQDQPGSRLRYENPGDAQVPGGTLPEPATGALMIVALAGLFGVRVRVGKKAMSAQPAADSLSV